MAMAMASMLSPPATSQLSSISFSKSLNPISKFQPSLIIRSSPATSSTATPLIYCGRGDNKTARGKRFNHSYGNARPKDKKKGRGPPRVTAPPLPPRKDKYDDGGVVSIEIDEF